MNQENSQSTPPLLQFSVLSTLSTQTSLHDIQVKKPQIIVSQFQQSWNSQESLILRKILAKIQNNESQFQIFRPKGDLQIPKDEEYDEPENKFDRKYEIYQQITQPLQASSMYSYNTLRMKLEIDLLLNEYFDSDEL